MADESTADARRVAATLPATRPADGSRDVVRALRSRNYRLFFGGQTVSLVGTWITRIATSWLVYRLTGSLLLLGIVGFCSQIPTLVLAPFVGVLVDRWDRHRILVVTQTLSMLHRRRWPHSPSRASSRSPTFWSCSSPRESSTPSILQPDRRSWSRWSRSPPIWRTRSR